MRGQGKEQKEGGAHKEEQGLSGEQGKEGVHRKVGARNLELQRLLWSQASDVTWACPKVQGGQSHREAPMSVTVTVRPKEGLIHPLYKHRLRSAES